MIIVPPFPIRKYSILHQKNTVHTLFIIQRLLVKWKITGRTVGWPKYWSLRTAPFSAAYSKNALSSIKVGHLRAPSAEEALRKWTDLLLTWSLWTIDCQERAARFHPENKEHESKHPCHHSRPSMTSPNTGRPPKSTKPTTSSQRAQPPRKIFLKMVKSILSSRNIGLNE